MRMADKVAIITMAGDEFGRAIALGFAREGADLYLNEWPDRKARLDDLAREATALGRRVVTGAHDLTRIAEVQAMTREVIEAFGRVDVLVNCAASSVHGVLFDIDEADFERAMLVGPKSYFLTCQQVGKEMARRGSGKIINLTSIVGRIGSGGAIVWGADRGAIDAMTKALAHALGLYGVHVNALARGASDFTPYSPDEVEERLRRLPFGRLGKAEDVVGPAIFLATADSDWVTGDVLYADGGYTSAAATDKRHRPTQVPYQGD
jgi:NAD(P)-dependent dehydrogenase (short-subunit alcohol dehydrogenase family)